MKRQLALLGAICALAGCELADTGIDSAPRPSVRPADAELSANASARSRALATFYARLEQDQKTRGLMRTDDGTFDAPFTDRMLADNFLAIALFDENPGNRIRPGTAAVPSSLRRWTGPVRIGMRFGESVPPEARATQRAQTSDYAARLGLVTGHPVSLTRSNASNFTIYVVNEDERRQLADELFAREPGIDATTRNTIASLPREVYCLVIAFSGSSGGGYSRAISIIRAELPPASWRSCLHEEVSQGLGLPNDSPRARPSIFNDDEEFALLTRHDELLLEMLYDPRLRPGMNAAEAAPIVRRIASELVEEPSS